MESLSGRSPDVADGYIAIGQIVAAWGVRGEVKVVLHTDFPQRFQHLETVYLGPRATPVALRSSRPLHGQILLRLAGCETRAEAEQLRGQWVQVPVAQAMPLAAGERYVFELVGLQVVTTDGRNLGEVVEVLLTAANEVLVVRGDSGEVLVPYINDVVVGEDLAGGRLLIAPVPGLLD